MPRALGHLTIIYAGGVENSTKKRTRKNDGLEDVSHSQKNALRQIKYAG